MKNLLTVICLMLVSAAPGFIPGPEQYETKWLLPRSDRPETDAESTHDYDARFYRIDLNLPMTSGAMTAHCGIWLASEVPSLDSAVFNFTRLVCDSVRRAARIQAFRTTYTNLIVYLDPAIPQGDSAYIEIYYHRNAGTQNQGFYFYLEGSGQGRNHTVCYSMTQPEDARAWFPCWDYPWDKAEQGCQVNITLPDSFRVCANGLLDSVSSNTDGTRTWWWTHRYPIPTYLINFAASIFKEITQWFHYTPTDSMIIRHWVWPEDSVQAMTAFVNVPDMVAFYSDSTRFGIYPFLQEKYGQVAVYPFSFGGMEHQTMTTIHRNWILYADESGIAHELAHMWFGDCVTCFTWADIWLNEGSASYLDPLWFYHHYGRQSFLDAMEDYRQYFFRADSLDRHPIYNPGMARLFDWGHTYCKAAWVNHMTRYVEGDTNFEKPGIWFAAERAWRDSFAYGNGTTEDRKRIHEQLTGLELDWFYNEWVYQAGFPNYSVNWYGRRSNDLWEIVIDVGQTNGSQAPACFHMPVEALVSIAGGSDTLLHWDITTNPQRNVFTLSGEPTALDFNPGKWILEKHSVTSGVENEIAPGAPVASPTLYPVLPNPARTTAIVRLGLPRPGPAVIRLYDAAGRCVRHLVFNIQHSVLSVPLAVNDFANGVYLVELSADGITDIKKLVVQR
ncbi:MAG: M1 family aminopeptidase [candidate division WOR-3 bacterium]